MRNGTSITLDAAARRRLETIAADRNAPQRHVWRARVVWLSADGVGTNAIMAATCTAKTTVWRWQERFVAEGADGLLRDKTRPAGKAPVPDQHGREGRRDHPEAAAARGDASDGAGHGQSRRPRRLDGAEDMEGARPRSHRWRRFKLSNDPAFAEKLHAVVGR
jgi:hypothetical protein